MQWAANGQTNQRWRFRDAGGGYYQVVSVNSGKCLDVFGGASATGDGVQVVQWTCNGGTNQQWRLQDAGGGYVQLVARHSGKCLDVLDAATTDGAQLVQWTCGTGTNQQWRRTAGDVTARSPPVWRRRVGFAPRPCVFVCPGALGGGNRRPPRAVPGPDRDPRPGRDQAGGRGDAPGAVRAGACRCHRYPVSSGSTSGWCRCCSPRARAGYRWTATATGRPGTGRRDG